MSVISFISAIVLSHTGELSQAVLNGAARALELTFTLLPMMCLWCGVMNVLKDSGAIEQLAHLISPLLKFLFPTAYETGNGIDECAANIAANMLGIGNAATPFAISALEKMQLDNKNKNTASDDMITLAVMNSSPISLFPMTLITLRAAHGSADAYRIMMPIWICSVAGWILSVLLSRVFAKLSRRLRMKK